MTTRQRKQKPPTYRRHKSGGRDRAFVVLNGSRVYLGTYGSPESREEYRRVLAEAEASNGIPHPAHADLSIADLLNHFRLHAEQFYRQPDGSPTSEITNFKQAVRPLHELYASARADTFGPRALKAVRTRMIGMGWNRSYINKQVGRLKLIFKWGVENELVPPSVYHGVQAVAGLKRGRSDARESEPVRPVPQADIDAIRPFLSRQVEAMIDLQLLTAARPGEIVTMRPIDLDTTGRIWTYTLAQHKTAHHGHDRRIYLGPKAQAIVKGFLAGRPVEAFIFSPAEAEAERREEAHCRRTTPLSCGNRPGMNRTAAPERAPADCYTVASYRRAISRACDEAFPPPEHLRPAIVERMVRGKLRKRRETAEQFGRRMKKPEHAQDLADLEAWRRDHRWHPHRLRHNAATALRKEYGLETARIILGHRSAAITEVYAELDHAKAIDVIGKVG